MVCAEVNWLIRASPASFLAIFNTGIVASCQDAIQSLRWPKISKKCQLEPKM